ncbi:alpha/beta hydrolase [Candidatus Poriferisocius sp.]|uniref:alpha/beta hydrolase n=1 Tax=Candidatus Poriferisocius sp. TaxID=3101276 RepID=UPI003B02184C
MALDPTAKAVMDMMEDNGVSFKGIASMTAVELRSMMQTGELPVEDVARTEDRVIPGADGTELPIRIYWPSTSDQPLPVVVFFHGGGWVIGGIDSHDGQVREMVNRTAMVYVSVDYRLAPEARFPAAAEDCYAATQWVAANAASIGADATRLGVAGDSAGGNLAAVVAQMARDRGGPAIAHQLLIYPCCDMDSNAWPSQTENGFDYFLTKESMDWFYDQYADVADRDKPYASPIKADDLSGLPPACVITAEYDPLRDEGEAYGARLQEAGVSCEVHRYDGMFHGFFGMTMAIPGAVAAQETAAAVVKAALSG